MIKFIYGFIKFFFVKPRVVLKFIELVIYSNYSLDKRRKIQWKKFVKLYQFAYQNSPYLNEKYVQAGLSINSINNRSDLVKIPILTREEIIHNADRILTVSSNHYNIAQSSTGGTTGRPMKFFRDSSPGYEAFYLFYLYQRGINPFTDSLHLWRFVKGKKYAAILNRIFWWPTKKIRLNGSDLTDEDCRRICFIINKIKPKVIHGYAGAVVTLAEFIERQEIKINRPKLLWSTAAPLSDTHRMLIRRVFGNVLLDEYGSKEIPWIAYQRNNQMRELHVNDTDRLLEVINNDLNPNGEIVITDLMDKKFPMIRYLNGDCGSFSKIKSENTLINPILGRSADNIKLINGVTLDSSAVTTIFNKSPDSINGFQIIVKNDGSSLKLLIIPNSVFKIHCREHKTAVENLRVLSRGLPIQYEYVKNIEDLGGKYRYLIKGEF